MLINKSVRCRHPLGYDDSSSLFSARFPCGPGRHLHALPLLLAPAQHVRDHQVPRGYWGGHLPLRQLPPRHHCQEKQIIVRHSPARAR